MFHLRLVDTLDLPELAPYRTMRRPLVHAEERIFVAEGEKVVRRLLESDFTIVSVLMPDKWLADFEPLLRARAEEFPVFVAPMARLEELVGFRLYQGVMAVGRFPQPASLESILEKAAPPRLLLALDGLSNAENLGVIIRNAAAFGAHAVIVGETCSTPYLRRAVRNSMGTIFKLPIVEPSSLAEILGMLRGRGFRCVAAHGHSKEITLSRCELRGDCCIVLGSEAHGLSPEVLAACDEAVAIPMSGEVDSLNVSNACAVFLYEAGRQRGRM